MTYRIEPKNRFFEANRSIVEFEIRPAYTVTFVSEVDLTEIEALRNVAAREGQQKPSYTAFVAKAVARAMREFPYANRRVVRIPWLPVLGKRLQVFERCDVAIAAERDIPGVEYCAFADIIRDADKKSLDELTRWLHELAVCDTTTNAQWRQFSGLIRNLPRWLSAILIRLPVFIPSLWVKYRGGAAMISSPAKYGVDTVLTTWTWPIGVSFGLVKERPVAQDGRLEVRTTFHLTLNFDRRVMAGAQGARFFKRFIDLLERATSELVETPFTRSCQNPGDARMTLGRPQGPR